MLTDEQTEAIGRHRFYLSKYKLSGVAELMAFMAGFSIISIAELRVDYDDNEWLLTGYTVTTCLLVVISTFVIMVNAWLLPHLKSDNDGLHFETEILGRPSSSALTLFRRMNRVKLDKETRHFIQGAWILASTVSVFLFTINIIMLTWIKFKFVKSATYAATGILSPFLLLLLYFGIMFRRKLLRNQLFQTVDFDKDTDFYIDLNQNLSVEIKTISV